jgi:DNA-binding NtrC family response regulator
MSGRVLIVEDEPLMREVLQARLAQAGFEPIAVGDVPDGVRSAAAHPPDVILTDLKLPSGTGLDLLQQVLAAAAGAVAPPVVVLTAYGSIESAVQAVKAGAYDYLTKPYEDDRLVLTLERAIQQKRLEEENRALRSELRGECSLAEFPTRSPKVRAVLEMAREVAENPTTTILIAGESGTGKEVLARAIHHESGRRNGRFVAIHCGAIPDTLLESELFGYEKGAFTGAAQTKKGKVELADGGTLFLDEIGDMPASLQVKLLRVLQERAFERLGGLDPIRVDVRVIAATHRDLAALVASGQFRADLYYRLNVFPLALPPLRERPEDIERLAGVFVQRYAAAMGRPAPSLSAGTLAALRAHAWPGNVRELQNVIERAVILCHGARIEPEHLPFAAPAAADGRPAPPPASLNLQEQERSLILHALEQACHQQSEAARLLGISRWQLRTKLERYGIRAMPGRTGS